MPKVLAVDDHAEIRRLVQINLERNGYEVVTAADGREALDKLKEDPPDLILCDVIMPQMDGFAFLKEVRSNPETARIPFILLTVKAQDADVQMGQEVGADAYLTKPFNPRELLSSIDQVLKAPQRP